MQQLAVIAETDPNNFGAVANMYRPNGVFTNDFMDFLEGQIWAAADDIAHVELLRKVQARIVNPLLKQGEYY